MNDAEYVIYARRQAGLKQSALAKRARVTAACVSQAERGLRKVSPRLMAAAKEAMAECADAHVVRNQEEEALIHIYRALPDESRKAVMSTAEALRAAVETPTV